MREEERALTQREAAELMGIDQPKVSHILHERLMHLLTGLGRDVEIVLRKPPKSRKHGRLRVRAA